jgi:hypothetical protein
LQRPHDWAQHGPHELLEQALLVAEVEIDRAFGDAGAAGDIVEPRRRKSAGGKFFERGREDSFAPRRLLIAAPVTGLAGRRRRFGYALPRLAGSDGGLCGSLGSSGRAFRRSGRSGRRFHYRHAINMTD